MWKLLLAEDHQPMLAAVRRALEGATNVEIVGEAQAGDQLLPLVGRTSPDVVLLDLGMPGIDGRCLEQLDELYPKVKTIVLLGGDAAVAVDASIVRGAVAFIRKTTDPAELADSIRLALAMTPSAHTEAEVQSPLGLASTS